MPLPDDETTLEILSLYEQGWEPKEIDGILSLCRGTAQTVVNLDAEEYPDEPLRADRVLH